MDVPVVIKCERVVRRSSRSNSIQGGRRNSTGPGIVEAKPKRRPSDGSAARRQSATRSDTFRSLQNFLSEGPVPQDGSDSTRSRRSSRHNNRKASPRTSATLVIIGDEFDGLDMNPSVLEESLRVAAIGDSKTPPRQGRRHSHHGSGRTERSHSFDDYFVPTNLIKTKPPLDNGEHSCSHSADEISDIVAEYYEDGNEDADPSLAFMSESFRLAKEARPPTNTNNKVRRGSRGSSTSSSRAPPAASNRRRSYDGAERRGSVTLRPGMSRRSSDPGAASTSDIFSGILGTFTGRLAEELNAQSSAQDDNRAEVQDEDDDFSTSKCTGDDSTALHDIIEGLEEAAEAGRSSIQVLTNENRLLKEANKQLVRDMEEQDEARREEIASLKAELKAMSKKNVSMNKVSEAKDAAVEKLTKDLEKRDATISALQDVVTALRKKIGY